MKLDNVSDDGQQCCMQSFKLCYLASLNPLTLCLHCHSTMHSFTFCLIMSGEIIVNNLSDSVPPLPQCNAHIHLLPYPV